jgi:5-formyltetrahydrofolate cyclo-ligase
MEATAQEKIELRKRMRTILASLPVTDVRARSATVWERLWQVADLVSADWLLVYVSKGNEVDTHGLIQQLLALGKHVCVPAFDEATQQYAASELRDFNSDLTEGRFEIPEPKPESVRPVEVDRLQALLVPGLAFDETGNRLGRGTGYFDRLLRDARGAKIALAYDFQILNEVPTADHDVRMDFIVTETRLINCQRKPT